MRNLKPCPFCGGDADFKRVGTAKMSCIVSCIDCGCTLEANEVGEACGTTQNARSNADVKQALFRVDEKINQESRMTKNAKTFAVAIVLNELSDIENNHSF